MRMRWLYPWIALCVEWLLAGATQRLGEHAAEALVARVEKWLKPKRKRRRRNDPPPPTESGEEVTHVDVQGG